MQDICSKQTKTTAASLVHVQRPRHGVGEETYFGGVFISDGINLKTWSKRAMELSGPLVHVCCLEIKLKIVCVCVCIPILVTTFPEWLSGTEPLPHTPGAVRPSSLCL